MCGTSCAGPSPVGVGLCSPRGSRPRIHDLATLSVPHNGTPLRIVVQRLYCDSGGGCRYTAQERYLEWLSIDLMFLSRMQKSCSLGSRSPPSATSGFAMGSSPRSEEISVRRLPRSSTPMDCSPSPASLTPTSIGASTTLSMRMPESESRAAAQGGVTTGITYIRTGQVLPESGRSVSEIHAPSCLKLAEGRAHVDYGFHVAPMQGLTHRRTRDTRGPSYGVSSFKIFMFYGGHGLHGKSDDQSDFFMTPPGERYDLAHFEFMMRGLPICGHAARHCRRVSVASTVRQRRSCGLTPRSSSERARCPVWLRTRHHGPPTPRDSPS